MSCEEGTEHEMWDDDFYDEPSEFEQQLSAFEESLKKAIKDEYIREMDALRTENTELQSVKERLDEINSEHRAKMLELDRKQRESVSIAKGMRLSELMEDRKIVMYRATPTTVPLPKCDNCDDKRLLHYTTPRGEHKSEWCVCKDGKTVYVPQQYVVYEFRVNRRGDKEITAWYRAEKSSAGDDEYFQRESTHCDAVYNSGMDYAAINKWGTFFKTEGDCQDYCDWLNGNEAPK